MKDDTQFNELGRAYRRIKAPANLAPRIVAEAEARQSRRRSYGLPLAAAAAVVALMIVIPFLSMQEGDESDSLRPMHIPAFQSTGSHPGDVQLRSPQSHGHSGSAFAPQPSRYGGSEGRGAAADAAAGGPFGTLSNLDTGEH